MQPLVYREDSRRIAYVATMMCGQPLVQWSRAEQEHSDAPIDWAAFQQLLLDWIMSPSSRLADSADQYLWATQGTTQSVRAFALHLKTIEDDLKSVLAAFASTFA